MVIYSSAGCITHSWNAPSLNHDHVVLTRSQADCKTAAQWMRSSEGAVFAYYGTSMARSLMSSRAESGKPWAFWGERPGQQSWKWLRSLRRGWLLAELKDSQSPIWGIGNWAVRGWQEEFGTQRRYLNVPYCSDLDRFNGREDDSKNKPRHFLFSGSLIHRKGIDLLCTSFLEIAKHRPELRLSILGGGSLEHELRKLVSPIADQVTFLGFRQWHELPDIYATADILVAPSRYDGWGMIIPEGLAAGLPVIVTDQMGAAIDLVTPGKNGWIVKAGELPSLTEALENAASISENKLDTMSRQARMSVRNHGLAGGVRRFAEASLAMLSDQRIGTCR